MSACAQRERDEYSKSVLGRGHKKGFLVAGIWLTLLDVRCPPKLLWHYSPQLNKGKKIKGSLVEIGMGKGSLIGHKTERTWEYKLNVLLKTSELYNEKIKNTFPYSFLLPSSISFPIIMQGDRE